jgi:hypothetical protein
MSHIARSRQSFAPAATMNADPSRTPIVRRSWIAMDGSFLVKSNTLLAPTETAMTEQNGAAWRDDEIARLLELKRSGIAHRQIATILGRTASAIDVRLELFRRRHRLSGRN